MKVSLFFKIFVIMFVVSAIPMSLLTTICIYNSNRVVEEEIVNKFKSLGNQVELRAKGIQDRNEDNLKSVAEKDRLQSALNTYNLNGTNPRAAVELAILDGISVFDGNVHRIDVAGLNGELLGSTDKNAEDKSYADANYFAEAMLGEYNHDYILNGDELAVQVVGPIKFEGKVVGVMFFETAAKGILEMVTNYEGLGSTGEIILIERDETGFKFLVPLRFDEGATLTKTFNETDTSSQGDQITGLKDWTYIANTPDYRGEPSLAVIKFVDEQHLIITIKMDRAEAFEPTVRLTNLLIFVNIAAALIIMFISLVVSRFITEPLASLIDVTQKIKDKDLSQRAEVLTRDEVGTLASSFNKMAAELQESYTGLEQKVAERTNSLLIEKNKINAIVESIGDAVFVVDKEEKLVTVNHICEILTGYKREEILGRKYTDFIKFVFEVDHKPNTEFVQRAITSGEITGMANHTLLITKQGAEVPVSDSAAPLLNDKGEVEGCVVVFRDVTREREVDRAKTDFVTIASHQLRTPLTSLKWFLEIILSGDLGKLKKDQQETIAQAYDSSNRMALLVNDLLNVSRLETGRLRIEPVNTDIEALIKETVKELKPIAKESKVKLETVIELSKKELPVDPTLLQQVIHNLLTNAIKYSSAVDKPEVTLLAQTEPKGLLITVQDNGVGIPQASQAQIFKKFYRADNVRKFRTEGSGLGLYLAKMIMDQSGGKLWFNSEEGKGTKFSVWIPAQGMKKQDGEKGLAESEGKK